MNRARFSSVVLSAALVFAPTAFAFQTEPAVVHWLGVTSIENARQSAVVNGFTAQGLPRESLHPLPRPHFPSRNAAVATTATLPNVNFQVVSANSGEHGFAGITSLDSNNANGGGSPGLVSHPIRA